jgi:ubiquinone/menaquinone biosynthesis C-methylase UbiE
LSTDEFLFAGKVVDLAAHDLPALKAGFIVRRVPDEAVLLDVGCGGGKMLRTISEHRRGVTLRGTDVVEPASLDGDFTFTPIDPETQALPFEDNSADVVTLVDVLEHVPQPERTLDEIQRVLKPGGRLLAMIPVEGEPVSWYTLFRALFGQDLYVRTKDHHQAYTHAQVKRMLGDRFTVQERRYVYHFVGQLMDAALCAALAIPWVRDAFWTHSPYHGKDEKPQGSLLGRIVSVTFKAANAVAYAESRLLRNVRATSAGQLLVAAPKK